MSQTRNRSNKYRIIITTTYHAITSSISISSINGGNRTTASISTYLQQQLNKASSQCNTNNISNNNSIEQYCTKNKAEQLTASSNGITEFLPPE
jgi:hypothetical protein